MTFVGEQDFPIIGSLSLLEGSAQVFDKYEAKVPG